jgi:hypothetical protein
LVQRRVDDFELKLLRREEVDPAVVETLRTRLGAMTGILPTIEVSEADDDYFSGKNRPIVSKVDPLVVA